MAQMPMPAQAAPEEGPAEQPQEGAPEGGDAGSPTKLIIGVDAGLAKIVAMLEQAQGVDPKIKESIGQALQMYRQGVEGLLGSAPGAEGPAGPQKKPMQGGAAPMESGGNPNAVPM